MTGPRAERRSDEKVTTEIKREEHSKETRADLSKKGKVKRANAFYLTSITKK